MSWKLPVEVVWKCIKGQSGFDSQCTTTTAAAAAATTGIVKQRWPDVDSCRYEVLHLGLHHAPDVGSTLQQLCHRDEQSSGEGSCDTTTQCNNNNNNNNNDNDNDNNYDNGDDNEILKSH